MAKPTRARKQRDLPALTPQPGLPGQRASLPKGALSKPYFGPQGDENRDPPDNAPSEPPQYRDDAAMRKRRGG
jgi:hypothetical protein